MPSERQDRADTIVVMQPVVEVDPERFEDPFAERDLIELLQDCLLEPLTNAVRLG